MNRPWRWIFIAVQALMFNVVVPGHTRGQVTVAGWERSTASCPNCCAEKSGKPTDDDKAHCAVCYFAAGLALPPPVMAVPALFGLVGNRPPIEILSSIREWTRSPLSARGPPTWSFAPSFGRGI